MNSLEPPETTLAQPQAQVQQPFDWIESLAVPIANAIMETQPIVLVLMIFLPFFIGQSAITSLDQVTITLLIVGLEWWAMFVRYRVQHGMDEYHTRVMHLLGLFLAFSVALATHIGMMDDIPALIVLIALTVWFWKRGMDRARKGLSDEQQVLYFKIGFVIIVVALFFFVMNSEGYNFLGSDFSGALAQALPLFFLSGLIGLSLTRLGLIRKENARRSPGSADPTRSWLAALVCAWILVVAAAIALEIFSFQAISNGLTPLWTVLGLIASGIFYVLYFMLQILTEALLFVIGLFFALLALIFGSHPQSSKPQSHTSPLPPPPHAHAPSSSSIGLIVLGIVLALALAFIIYTLQKRWHIAHDDGSEEETREGLSMRSILRARRQERQQRRREQQAALEALDPDSARARYREFLQALADASAELERRPGETPAEYQGRLLRTRPIARTAAPGDDAPPGAAILDELTRAYNRERYGARRGDEQQREYLRRWVPRLVQRLLTR